MQKNAGSTQRRSGEKTRVPIYREVKTRKERDGKDVRISDRIGIWKNEGIEYEGGSLDVGVPVSEEEMERE